MTKGWNEVTKGWNEVTKGWNEVTKGWNGVAWNEVVMERSDQISFREPREAKTSPFANKKRVRHVTETVRMLADTKQGGIKCCDVTFFPGNAPFPSNEHRN